MVVRDGIGELGEEAQQEVYVINHTEEILAMLTVEAEVNEVNEADIANKVIPGKQMIIDEVKRLMTHGKTGDNIIFKKVDQKKYSEETGQVNGSIKHLSTGNITQTNNLVAGSLWVAKHLGLKESKKNKNRTHGRK